MAHHKFIAYMQFLSPLPAFLYHTRHSKQAKVCNHHLVCVIEHILGLQILVNDAFSMKITHSLQQTKIF